ARSIWAAACRVTTTSYTGSTASAQTAQQLVGGNRFAAVGFSERRLELRLELKRYDEALGRVTGNDRHHRPFGQRLALDDDLAADHCSSRDPHATDTTRQHRGRHLAERLT